MKDDLNNLQKEIIVKKDENKNFFDSFIKKEKIRYISSNIEEYVSLLIRRYSVNEFKYLE